MTHDQVHEPTFGPRGSEIDHPMPDMTENYIAEEDRLEHELTGIQKHLADIRAKCHHHFVPSKSLEEMGLESTLVHEVYYLPIKGSTTFICTQCAASMDVALDENGRCPHCGAKLEFGTISYDDQKRCLGDQITGEHISLLALRCSSCNFLGIKIFPF